MNKYFSIPFANVPANPSYKVWFASWSSDRPVVTMPPQLPPFVIGLTTDDRLPAGATLLVANDTKEPPPPPPPIAPTDPGAYGQAFGEWLRNIKEG